MSEMTTNTTLLSSTLLSNLENVGCVTLKDLIYHEDLESMVQFNFMIDIDFLIDNIYNKNIPITVIHGLRDNKNINIQAKQWPNIKISTPEIKDRYGVHHTKAMMLFFRDGKTGAQSAQVIVLTANLVRQDWKVMTQDVYRTPRCSLKTHTSFGASVGSISGTVVGSDYGSPFERDLVKYLRAYKLQCLMSIITKLRLYDWSPCKVILIGSVPGYHRQSAKAFSDWGLERLAHVLRQNVELAKPCCLNSQIIVQCSSIPHSPERWFKQDFCVSMSEAMNSSKAKQPNVCVIYPTMKTATNSFTGRDMSGYFLRFEKTSYEKNHTWFDRYLYDWKSQDAGRQSLMPHIKTYTRVYNVQGGKTLIAWHLLTSSNLSRAAWGEYQKNRTQIYIKSFELGVFFCPSLWEDDAHPEIHLTPQGIPGNSLKEDTANTVKVRFPYDLPLVRHPGPLQCFTRLQY